MPDINYIYNDPTTPELIGPVDFPPKPNVMDFRVDGFRGATSTLYTPEHQAACCYYTIINAINMATRYLNRPLTNWSTVPQLVIQPRAGQQLNAFYDRFGIKMFYALDPIEKKMIYTSDSADVFRHEIGHAILDAIRPDLFNMQSMEIWAYHESFGDQNAIMNILQYDIVLDYVLKETNGDIRKNNCVSKIA